MMDDPEKRRIILVVIVGVVLIAAIIVILVVVGGQARLAATGDPGTVPNDTLISADRNFYGSA